MENQLLNKARFISFSRNTSCQYYDIEITWSPLKSKEGWEGKEIKVGAVLTIYKWSITDSNNESESQNELV